MTISKPLAKEILIILLNKTGLGYYTDVVNDLELIYNKINLGGRYSYCMKYKGELTPVITFRIDLSKQNILINTNIIQILKDGQVSDMYYANLFDYNIAEDIISKYRINKIESILD